MQLIPACCTEGETSDCGYGTGSEPSINECVISESLSVSLNSQMEHRAL